jgi:23S rRNA (cytidine1920-2'-O)/16S rRNA (cytidine1409-2'-O)-methyltransferase
MRADKFFAEKFGSRTKAKEALEQGLVLRSGKALQPKDEIDPSEAFEFLSRESYVSAGGKKLARGLDVFKEDVTGKTFADLGASTGGFTDCLLKRGTRRVYCVDVGESQLDARIASDPRVCVMDKTNARYLNCGDFPEPIEGIVSDLSFISLKLILPAIRAILPSGGNAFVLYKPQFECGGKGLGKSGILPQRYHEKLLKEFYAFCNEIDLAIQNAVNAPLVEKKNIEYMIHVKKDSVPISMQNFILKISEIY